MLSKDLRGEALRELARALMPLQRQILLSLREKGACTLLEIAVRVLKFPEEVSGPVSDLRDQGLVTMSQFSGSAFGKEMIYLTPLGEQLALVLRDQAFLESLKAGESKPPVAQVAPDPRRQEADLLQKLGDMAKQAGELDKATSYYEQALEVTRKLSTSQ